MVPLISGFCIALYVLALFLDIRGALGMRGGSLLGFLAPNSVALGVLGATSPRAGFLSLFTAIYLHGSLLHLFFNLLWVRSLAPEVQRGFGAARFFIIWSVAGAFGFFISNRMPGPGSIGASGSIFGLMAALIVYGRVIGASLMTRQIWQYALILGALGFLLPGVDNLAHVGGFAGGWVTATAFRGSLGKPDGRPVTLLAIAFIALTVLGFLLNIDDVIAFLVSMFGRG